MANKTTIKVTDQFGTTAEVVVDADYRVGYHVRKSRESVGFAFNFPKNSMMRKHHFEMAQSHLRQAREHKKQINKNQNQKNK